MPDRDRYISPLSGRYASKEMQHIFSQEKKFKTWRRLWIALAETEMELGLPEVTEEMVQELKDHAEDINYEVAEKVGYQDIAYFSNTFKKLVGKSPSEYQAKGLE